MNEIQQDLSDDVSLDRPLTRQQEIALKNRRTGLNIFQASWIMAFICLAIVNLQLRGAAPTWPPAGVEPLSPVLPTLVTVGLLVSVWLARRGALAITALDLRGFVGAWRATLLLGLAFIAVMAFEWMTVPGAPQTIVLLPDGSQITGDTTQYYTVFRLMTGFHAVHALAIVYYLFSVLRRAQAGAFKPTRTRPAPDTWDVEAGAKLWYFVVVAWILFYVVLYWV